MSHPHPTVDEKGRKSFLELAAQLVRASNAAEQARLKEELVRLTFGV